MISVQSKQSASYQLFMVAISFNISLFINPWLQYTINGRVLWKNDGIYWNLRNKCMSIIQMFHTAVKLMHILWSNINAWLENHLTIWFNNQLWLPGLSLTNLIWDVKRFSESQSCDFMSLSIAKVISWHTQFYENWLIKCHTSWSLGKMAVARSHE